MEQTLRLADVELPDPSHHVSISVRLARFTEIAMIVYKSLDSRLWRWVCSWGEELAVDVANVTAAVYRRLSTALLDVRRKPAVVCIVLCVGHGGDTGLHDLGEGHESGVHDEAVTLLLAALLVVVQVQNLIGGRCRVRRGTSSGRNWDNSYSLSLSVGDWRGLS